MNDLTALRERLALNPNTAADLLRFAITAYREHEEGKQADAIGNSLLSFSDPEAIGSVLSDTAVKYFGHVAGAKQFEVAWTYGGYTQIFARTAEEAREAFSESDHAKILNDAYASGDVDGLAVVAVVPAWPIKAPDQEAQQAPIDIAQAVSDFASLLETALANGTLKQGTVAYHRASDAMRSADLAAQALQRGE